jgi:DNA-binding MarR family transcriptional regulator
MQLEKALQSSKFSSPVQKAHLNVLYTAWWLKTQLTKTLKEFDLTHEQYNVLRILKGKHPETLCVKEIAGRMIERSSNVPRIIDRLVLKKLVLRSTSEVDKRETVMQLTQAGMVLLAESTIAVDMLMQQLITLSNHEAEQLSKLCEKLRENEQ